MDSSTSHVVKSALAPLELPDLSLAELILSGKIKDGDNVAVSAGKSGLTFNGQVVKEAA